MGGGQRGDDRKERQGSAAEYLFEYSIPTKFGALIHNHHQGCSQSARTLLQGMLLQILRLKETLCVTKRCLKSRGHGICRPRPSGRHKSDLSLRIDVQHRIQPDMAIQALLAILTLLANEVGRLMRERMRESLLIPSFSVYSALAHGEGAEQAEYRK